MLTEYLPNLLSYLSYYLAGIIILSAFIALYLQLTPYDDIKLIKQGNVCAAIILMGSMFSLALGLASSAWHSDRLPLFIIWGVISGSVQLLLYVISSRFFFDLSKAVTDNNIAIAMSFTGLSIAIGILNAGCLS